MRDVQEPATLAVQQHLWEGFLQTFEEFIEVHRKTLTKLRELKRINALLRSELRAALAAQVVNAITEAKKDREPSTSVQEAVCAYCKHTVLKHSNYCDSCGMPLDALVSCICGRQIKKTDRHCDGCGRRVLARY